MGEWVQLNFYFQLLLFALLVIGMFKGHIPAPKAPSVLLAPESLRIKQLNEQASTLPNFRYWCLHSRPQLGPPRCPSGTYGLVPELVTFF